MFVKPAFSVKRRLRANSRGFVDLLGQDAAIFSIAVRPSWQKNYRLKKGMVIVLCDQMFSK